MGMQAIACILFLLINKKNKEKQLFFLRKYNIIG